MAFVACISDWIIIFGTPLKLGGFGAYNFYVLVTCKYVIGTFAIGLEVK